MTAPPVLNPAMAAISGFGSISKLSVWYSFAAMVNSFCTETILVWDTEGYAAISAPSNDFETLLHISGVRTR